jgi:NitT/TauT family transport system substrate-binding protein
MKAATGLAIALIVATALGFGTAPAAAQSNSRTVVKVGVTGRADQAKVELAYRRGYFAELGLDLQLISGGASALEYLSSLATNQIQVGAGSPNAAMLNALNRGIDMRIVADWAQIANGTDPTMSLIARTSLMDSGAIESVADLRGRTVSLGPNLGSVNEMFFDKSLASAGLKRSDVDAVQVGFGDALAALGSGKIDAAVVIEPLVWTAQQQKIARALTNVGDIDPGAQVAVLIYSPEFARNTDAATRFMIGYLRGIRDFNEAFFERKNLDATIDILVEHLALKDRRVWTESLPPRTDLNGRVNVAHIKAQAEYYKATGTLTGPIPDIDKVVDMKFADEAVKKLGRR